MDVEQRARELLGAEYRAAHAKDPKINFCTGEFEVAVKAVIAALTPPEGHVVVTRNRAGQAVAVTRQDDDGRIMSVIAEFGPTTGWAYAADRELVAAELGVARIDDSTDVAAEKLRELIDWHVSVATDPAVNGGYVLVPVELTKGIEEALNEALKYGYQAESAWDLAIHAARPEVKP